RQATMRDKTGAQRRGLALANQCGRSSVSSLAYLIFPETHVKANSKPAPSIAVPLFKAKSPGVVLGAVRTIWANARGRSGEIDRASLVASIGEGNRAGGPVYPGLCETDNSA